MRVFSYDSSTISALQSMIGENLIRLINGLVSVVLDFGDFHIAGELIEQPAASPHKFGEVITLKFEKRETAYPMKDIDEVITENATIKRVWILRALIYFSNLTTYNSREEALDGVPEPESEFEARLSDLLGGSSAGYSDNTTNPSSEVAKRVPNEISNLVDVGILLQTENKYYACTPIENKYFSTVTPLSESELEEKIIAQYQLIDIDHKSSTL